MTEVHFYQPEVPLSIWIDRGPNGGWMFRTEKQPDSVRQYVAADRIEALAAENEALKKWHTVAAEEVNRLGSENEALRALVASNDATIAAWLRSKDAYEMASQSEHGDLLTLADAIERGDHIERTDHAEG